MVIRSLIPDEKSKYIGRGHRLTKEQFDYLWKNKSAFYSLLEQYVKTGLQLDDYQIDIITTNKDLKDNYTHNRIIANEHQNNLSTKEYSILNPEQKKIFLKYSISKRRHLTTEQFDYLWDNKVYSLLEQYVKTGLKLNDYQIDKIATNEDLKDKYINTRLHGANLGTKEYSILNPEQKNEFYKIDKLNKVIKHAFDIDLIKELIKNGENPSVDSTLSIINFLIKENRTNEVVEILNQENIKNWDDSTVNYLLNNVNGKQEMINIILKHKTNLTSRNVSDLFLKSESLKEIAKILGTENINNLDERDFKNLIRENYRQQEMINILLNYKTNLTSRNLVDLFIIDKKNRHKFLEMIVKNKIKFDSNDTAQLLGNADSDKETEELAKMLYINNEENINQLKDDQVEDIVRYYAPQGNTTFENRKKIIEIILKYKRNLNKHNAYTLLSFCEGAKKPQEIVDVLNRLNPQIIEQFDKRDVYSLIRNAREPQEMAAALGGDRMKKLDNADISNLIHNSNYLPIKLIHTLASMISPQDIFQLLQNPDNKNDETKEIVDALGQENLFKISRLLYDRSSHTDLPKEEMDKIILSILDKNIIKTPYMQRRLYQIHHDLNKFEGTLYNLKYRTKKLPIYPR